MALLKALLLVAALALLGGCAAGPGTRSNPDEIAMAESLYRDGEFAAAARAFLDAAEVSRSGRDVYRLRAGEAWREDGNPAAARQALDGINERRLDDTGRLRLTLLRAELALGEGNEAGARRLLESISSAPPAVYRARWLELRGRAHERDDPFFAARLYAELGTLLQGRERTENARRVRDLLAGLRDNALRQGAAGLRGEDPLRPHAVRALTSRGFSVPPQLQRQATATAASPVIDLAGRERHVALVLPLTGPLKSAAEAVRDGFLSARFAELESSVRISVIDAGSEPEGALRAYRQAVALGADSVVGPLTRDAVGLLFAENDLPVPILALNRGSLGIPNGHLSFALAPEEEGAAIATRMAQRGLLRVLVVASADDASQRALTGFQQRLQRGGGSLVGTVAIDDRGIDFQQPIRQALQAAGLPTSAPQDLNQPHDPGFDAVFIAVRAPVARLLVPQLKVFGLSEVPMLATSLIHVPGQDARMDRDLNGIEFCDSPWLVDDLPGLPGRATLAAQLGSAQGSGARLFAFGMDAWLLLRQRASGDPSVARQGATGMLSIDELGEAQREPGIAVFRNGRPRLVRDGGLIPDGGPQG